jgi:Mrp family chromosome partitioning ATPase
MQAQKQKEAISHPSAERKTHPPPGAGKGAGPKRGPKKAVPLVELVAAPKLRQALRPLVERFLAPAPRGSGVYCISSALVGEGKTLVSAALALMLTERSEKKVLLVDANLRRPGLHQLLGVSLSPGLADCIHGDCSAWDATSVVGTLCVLPGGADHDPSWLLRKAATKRLLEEARSTYDLTFIDLPPLPFHETPSLVAWSDGLLLVVRANSTTASEVATALGPVDREKLLGVVLNREQPDLPRWLQRLL